jgi:hypothetical protein
MKALNPLAIFAMGFPARHMIGVMDVDQPHSAQPPGPSSMTNRHSGV